MLPPLPSTNWRIQSFLPTVQISFLMASASGVKNRAGLALPGRDKEPFWEPLRVTVASAVPLDPGAPDFAQPLDRISILRCCRKSRADGVMTQLAQVTT